MKGYRIGHNLESLPIAERMMGRATVICPRCNTSTKVHPAGGICFCSTCRESFIAPPA